MMLSQQATEEFETGGSQERDDISQSVNYYPQLERV